MQYEQILQYTGTNTQKPDIGTNTYLCILRIEITLVPMYNITIVKQDTTDRKPPDSRKRPKLQNHIPVSERLRNINSQEDD